MQVAHQIWVLSQDLNLLLLDTLFDYTSNFLTFQRVFLLLHLSNPRQHVSDWMAWLHLEQVRHDLAKYRLDFCFKVPHLLVFFACIWLFDKNRLLFGNHFIYLEAPFEMTSIMYERHLRSNWLVECRCRTSHSIFRAVELCFILRFDLRKNNSITLYVNRDILFARSAHWV